MPDIGNDRISDPDGDELQNGDTDKDPHGNTGGEFAAFGKSFLGFRTDIAQCFRGGSKEERSELLNIIETVRDTDNDCGDDNDQQYKCKCN